MKCFSKKIAALLAVLCACVLSFTACALLRPADDTTKPPIHSDESDTTDTTDTDDTANTNPPDTTDPVTTEPPVQEKRVSVLAVGDNIIHEAVFTDAKNRAADGAEYDFVPMYADVAEKIAAADIAFINHETPLAGNEKGISGFPTFNAPREAAEALVAVGFDVINLANNHLLDKRVVGARATVEYVQSLPVAEIGAYLDEADFENIRVTEANGIRIAWVSFTYGSNHAYNPATDDIIMPLLNDDSAITARIDAAEELADFVIVSVHWGEEYKTASNQEQRNLAALMSEAGADVILGHHPHVLQPVEWHENRDGSRTLVAYSLGNFLSTQEYAPRLIGGMLTFDVVMKDGVLSVENPILNPTVTQYSKTRDSLQIYLLDDYTDSLAKAHGCTLKHTPEFSLEWIYNHVRSIISDDFLPAYFE